MEKFDSLATLNSNTYDWKIKVRVIRIWDSYSIKEENEFKGRNLLLLDDKVIFFLHSIVSDNNYLLLYL